MAQADKYSIIDLKAQFPTDVACLEYLFDTLHTRDCSCGGTYSRLVDRKQYQCSKCRFQIAPMAGTIFEKSSTSLTLWFHAVFVFSNAKSGVSAKEMERQLGVTYKTAWRILKLIREQLKQSTEKLGGDVEMDEAWFGGRGYGGKLNKNQRTVMKAKVTVIGAVERQGRIRAEVTEDTSAWTIKQFLQKNIEPAGTRLFTDESNRYDKVAAAYDRRTVNHSREQYVMGDAYVNSIEQFWAHVKRSVKGTHKVILRKHFASYLDAFVFHYNNRRSDRQRFAVLLGALVR